MRLSTFAAAATILACAQAFKDTSPFLMISSSPLPESFATAETLQLQSRHTLLHNTGAFLATCPSERYYIITQPSILPSELAAYAPNLKRAAGDASVKGRLSVAEVVGLTWGDAEQLAGVLEKECGVVRFSKGRESGMKGTYVLQTMSAIEGDRAAEVGDADASLANVLDSISSGLPCTFIYLTTPATNVAVQKQGEEQVYKPEFKEPLHMDLKRDVYARARNESGVPQDLRPLFEKYQFFSPGLFMGGLVSLLLLSILFVGIKAISSLEVSYGAFDKEMGPSSNKKQQ